MGQDEPAVPMGGPLEINVQTLEEEQTDHLPEDLGSVPAPDSSLLKEETKCAAPTHESAQDTSPLPVADPIPHLAAAPDSTALPEPEVQSSAPAVFPAPEVPEEKASAESEPPCNGFLNQAEPSPAAKSTKSKPPSLNIKAAPIELVQTNEEEEIPVPKAAYNFDPDQMDDSFNPFTSGGPKIQNSPPPCGPSSLHRLEPIGSASPTCEASSEAQAETMASSSEAKPMMLEFGLDEGTVSKPPPKRLGGKKTISKLASKKQRPKVSEASSKPEPEPPVSETDSQPAPEPVSQSLPEPNSETSLPVSDSCAPVNLDDVPIPKTGVYNFDPNQWDDPNFNPFGSNSKVSSSPVLPKGSYSFDPDNFDDSVDPFKPSTSISTEVSSSSAPQAEKKVKEGSKQKARQTPGEKKPRQIPKKNKEKTIT